VALVILVLITSGGIFGYLSNAYQGATLGLDKITSKMQVLEQTKERVYDDRNRINITVESLRSERQNTIENRNEEIASMTITDTTRYYDRLQRSKIYNRYKPELESLDIDVKKANDNMDSINVKLSRVEQQISDMKVELIETGADVGPVIFIAQAFDTSVDNVVKFFIFILIFVFDPLAIVLVIATNKVMLENWNDDNGLPKKSFFDKFKRKKKESMYGDDLPELDSSWIEDFGPAGHEGLEEDVPKKKKKPPINLEESIAELTEKVPTAHIRDELKP